MKVNVEGLKPNDLRNYVEQPRIYVIIEKTKLTNQNNELTIHLHQPMHEPHVEVEYFTSQTSKVICFANLLLLPHLFARRTRRIKPFVDYNISHVVTSNEYLVILQQKNLDKEVVEHIKEHKRKEKKRKENS
jgi:hypothetical protein